MSSCQCRRKRLQLRLANSLPGLERQVDDSVRADYKGIRAAVHLESGTSERQLQQLRDIVKPRCAVRVRLEMDKTYAKRSPRLNIIFDAVPFPVISG
jgi:hypothetical protein